LIELNKSERLVFAGNAVLRAPNGEPLTAVPQYIIVPADKADPTAITEIESGKQLVCGGLLFTDKQRAEERFAALKAGRALPLKEPGTPLCFMEDVSNCNPKTGRTHGSEGIIHSLSEAFAEMFEIRQQKDKA